MQRSIMPVFLTAALLLSLPAAAQYNYGGGSTASAGGAHGTAQGFVVLLEGMLMNPRNTDMAVATVEGLSQLQPAIPDWDDEFAGRLGLGYKWASGNQLMFSVWSFSADNDAELTAATGQRLFYAIGPPIPFNGDYVGTTGGSLASAAELDAGSAELMFGREHEISEGFLMEWGLGVQYARYEETQAATYSEVEGFDSSRVPLLASKSIESEMFGARVKARGTYRFSSHWSVTAGLGFSFLDGEIDTRSRLDPQGTIGGSVVPYNEYVLVDDSRSGSIVDFDVAVAWHAASDRVRVYLGWEQQRWDGLPTDTARNFPGTVAPLDDRDSVRFSGYKLGLRFVF